MKTEFEQIRNAQKESWNKFSPGWRKWDKLTMDFLKPHGDEIIRLINPGGSDFVLDVAAGTGEPGLTIAPMLTEGKVIVTDLSDGMLRVASVKAAERGIKNLETMVADACELPFADNSFDAISCRFGFMFFPNMLLAVKEMTRVLKPGGRIATTVWGSPEKNYWVTCIMQNIGYYIEMPSPPEGAPGMFRCAKPGFVSELFKQAGLKNTSEEELTAKLNCQNAEEYWDMMTDIAAPFVEALSNTDEETKEKIRVGVIDSVNEKYPGNTTFDTSGIIIYGEK
ncbi:MAG TPA: methyltransferase domain-containing protein [Candidatus Scalindua sp.]|nr:methyltransferase domain-containing protein [Candidatus Scalindua sp.]